jgi:hypothetical protein
MRTPPAIAIFLGALSTLNSAADAAPRKSKRSANPSYYTAQPPYYFRGDPDCGRRARAEDPTGLYAGYPCWARESFGRGGSVGRGA